MRTQTLLQENEFRLFFEQEPPRGVKIRVFKGPIEVCSFDSSVEQLFSIYMSMSYEQKPAVEQTSEDLMHLSRYGYICRD